MGSGLRGVPELCPHPIKHFDGSEGDLVCGRGPCIETGIVVTIIPESPKKPTLEENRRLCDETRNKYHPG